MSECYCSVSKKVVKTRRVILFLKILDVILKCGTEYSGFNSVDLQKWSLKLPAGKYKINGEVNLLSNAAKESKSGVDHMSEIPQMIPNTASRARMQYFLINESSNLTSIVVKQL